MIIIWCMVPEICSMTEFLSFWALFFFFFFCPFTPLLTLKIKIWEKCEKKQDMCTINEDHMMYSSWDIRHNEQSLLSFWVIFPLWPPSNNPKNEIWKKWKKKRLGDIIILHRYTISDNHMMYGSPKHPEISSFHTIPP